MGGLPAHIIKSNISQQCQITGVLVHGIQDQGGSTCIAHTTSMLPITTGTLKLMRKLFLTSGSHHLLNNTSQITSYNLLTTGTLTSQTSHHPIIGTLPLTIDYSAVNHWYESLSLNIVLAKQYFPSNH